MFAYRTQVYPLLHWYTVLLPALPLSLHCRHTVLPCRHAICILIYTQHQPYTAMHTMLSVYHCQSEYTARSPPAPLHMPLRRSYFNSDWLLLLGYKYPALVAKMRYSLIMAVWRLSGGIRLSGCCNRGALYTVCCVGWGGGYIIYCEGRGTPSTTRRA